LLDGCITDGPAVVFLAVAHALDWKPGDFERSIELLTEDREPTYSIS
jgi:hypothetical protein